MKGSMREFLNYYEIHSLGRIYDGDTLKCWTKVKKHRLEFDTLRLLDIDTPEINNREQHAAAVLARDYVIVRLGEAFISGENLIFWAENTDSFGRLLAKVYIGNTCLNKELLDKGLADPYSGRKQVRYL